MAYNQSANHSLLLIVRIKNLIVDALEFKSVVYLRKRFIPHLLVYSSLLIAALGLVSCGGGGGDDSAEQVIAPESFDNVQMEFFGAFTMQCLRLSGTAGNEQGAVSYVRRRQSFRYATTAPGGNLGSTIELPLLLSNVTYNYVRTGLDTGRVTFTFSNGQAYPHPQATAQATQSPAGLGDMFWGGRNFTATELVVDILFTNSGGFIGSNTSRIRSGYRYFSTWNPTTMSADNFADPFNFDTPETSYRFIGGAQIPIGYNPYEDLDQNAPASAVWRTLQDRKIIFRGTDGVDRVINQQAVGGVGAPISGISAEENGTILVDELTAFGNLLGVGGTYSYHRTGGNRAKLSIKYNRINSTTGLSETLSLVYDVNFTSLQGGSYVDSAGVSGTFLENTLAPL